MKKITFLTATALAGMLAMSSCDRNDDKIENTDNVVRFTASIHGQATGEAMSGTRAADTEWADGDAIGIFMINHVESFLTPTGGDIVDNAVNKKYTASLNGMVAIFNPDTYLDIIYYPEDGSTVDFIAYYPWQEDRKLTSDITDQYQVEIEPNQKDNPQTKFDLLYAFADNESEGSRESGSGFGKTSIPVPLTFTHQLSKLVMNVYIDDKFENIGDIDRENVEVEIKGMNIRNSFDLATGELGTAETPADITPRNLGGEPKRISGREITPLGSFDAIIMPGTYSATDKVQVVFTINKENEGGTIGSYTWNVDEVTFEKSTMYTYTVVLTPTYTTAEGTITNWVDVDIDEVDVGKDVPQTTP